MNAKGDKDALLVRFKNGPAQLEHVLEGLTDAGLDYIPTQVVGQSVKSFIILQMEMIFGSSALKWHWESSRPNSCLAGMGRSLKPIGPIIGNIQIDL